MKKLLLASAFLALSLTNVAATACTFNWQHYGNDEVYKRIKTQIGSAVTDEFCNKYNKNYEIFIMTNAYTNTQLSLGHATVGLRKRGDKGVPTERRSSYQSESGNFVIAKGYELAAGAALDTLKDIMSAPAEYISK